MPITEEERVIINCSIMKLDTKKSIQYMKDHGFPMQTTKFFKIKKKLGEDTLKRLHEIGTNFTAMHLERIDQLELIQDELWGLYNQPAKPIQKAMILKEIRETQRYISAYHESTQEILERHVNSDKTRDSISAITIKS